MRNRFAVLGLGISLFSAAAAADDLAGAEKVLCTPLQATICSLEGGCEDEAPWTLNVPKFVEIDLKEKTLSTTKASGENRMTPIRTLLREGGEIFLQGIESGRAFSFVIEEESGMVSIAVAREGKTVSIFGACTPMPAAR